MSCPQWYFCIRLSFYIPYFVSSFSPFFRIFSSLGMCIKCINKYILRVWLCKVWRGWRRTLKTRKTSAKAIDNNNERNEFLFCTFVESTFRNKHSSYKKHAQFTIHIHTSHQYTLECMYEVWWWFPKRLLLLSECLYIILIYFYCRMREVLNLDNCTCVYLFGTRNIRVEY